MIHRAVIFDVDGVLTSTAEIHRRAWTALFAELFAGRDVEPFSGADYKRLVDGRARHDGLVAVLEDRGGALGVLDAGELNRLAGRKQELFLSILDAEGVSAFPDVERCLTRLTDEGIRVSAVSASRNASRVLTTAGLASRIEFLVDGVRAEEQALAGKPDPAMFLEAARLLQLGPGLCVVVEDALAGVTAARAGEFGLVVGLDRTGVGRPELQQAADVVLTSLDELVPHLARRTVQN